MLPFPFRCDSAANTLLFPFEVLFETLESPSVSTVPRSSIYPWTWYAFPYTYARAFVSNERRSRIRRRKENVRDSKLVSLICVSMLTVRLQPFENDRPSWLRSKPRANSKRLQTLSRTVLRATRSNPFTVRLGSWSTVRFASATRFTRNYSEES